MRNGYELKIMFERDVYCVVDVGSEDVLHTCHSEITANRLIYERDIHAREVQLEVRRGIVMDTEEGEEVLYTPCMTLEQPSPHDLCKQEAMGAYKKAKAKAEELGLPDHMIATLTKGPYEG